ncbi:MULTISPECIES: hypothetical protein [Brevibacterium]|uniref:hypothetical protein n=1 Tax=Brevibacterium TaxID=1696 RepID=UPI0025C27219|nr:hypothetical protein [Brevibacterium sp.]
MEYIKVLLPSIGVGLLFWYVMRGILRSDSTEREEMEKYYQQIDRDGAHEEAVEGQLQNAPAGSGGHSEQEGAADGTRDEGRPD